MHLIARFVNREYLLAGPRQRLAYLERIPAALQRTDWVPLAFALMGSHVHLVLVAGQAAPQRLFHGLHRSFAAWINQTQGRLGPVFAGRPKTIYMPPERTGALVAYVHNNPVRGRVVASAADSDWSSHRMWIGAQRTPPWLDVERGLRWAGFEPSAAGRVAFAEFVQARADNGRDPVLSGDLAEVRRRVRGGLALPVELASPVVASGGEGKVEVALRYVGTPAMAPRWPGDLDDVVHAVAAQTGVLAVAIRSRSRLAEIVRARRLVAVIGILGLRRRGCEVAAALGVAESSVCEHLRRLDPAVVDIARQIEGIVRGGGMRAA